jgi:hypothetical protein
MIVGAKLLKVEGVPVEKGISSNKTFGARLRMINTLKHMGLIF